MDVNVFLADSVVAAENKLYAQGVGWDSIIANRLPCVHPRLGIGVLFQVSWEEANHTHEFSLDIEDPDGDLLPLSDARPEDRRGADVRGLMGQLNAGKPPLLQSGESQVVPIAINIDQLTITKAGSYSIVVGANGRELRRVPFYVRSAATKAPIASIPRHV